MVVVVNLGRAVVLAALVATIVSGTVNIAVVLAALFILGTAETFADSASSTLIPSLVAREDLGVADARMQGAFLLTNQLLTPPIGAFLFAIGMAMPFATNAACFALGALFVSRVVTSARSVREEPSSLRAAMVEGVRWLLAHPPMRTLALTILAFNVTHGAAWSVLVLYVGERLHMNEVGFGLLTTAGRRRHRGRGLVRMARAPVLARQHHASRPRHRDGDPSDLALTTSAAVALATMVVFGGHAFVWGTTSTVVRQRAVPDALMGRVGGVYRVAIVGGLVVGTPLGGLLAKKFGITAPFGSRSPARSCSS
jgi:hypothetical protein